MPESRCGLVCSTCSYKESHGCGGCIETNSHPFHGECRIAQCCQEKGYTHCGECDVIPCKDLYAYSFLDPQHGDKPPGARVLNCRRYAADVGKHKWGRVLLTSAGFAADGQPESRIKDKFLELLAKAPAEARVLFIPTAAISEGARQCAKMCVDELLEAGIKKENILEHNIDGSMTEAEAMGFDVIYFPGGSTAHLLQRIKETGFDAVIKKVVHADKLYVGVSAGSLIATPNIDKENVINPDTAGLALVHAYMSVHCDEEAVPRTDLPLAHICLNDRQALWVTYAGWELVEE